MPSESSSCTFMYICLSFLTLTRHCAADWSNPLSFIRSLNRLNTSAFLCVLSSSCTIWASAQISSSSLSPRRSRSNRDSFLCGTMAVASRTTLFHKSKFLYPIKQRSWPREPVYTKKGAVLSEVGSDRGRTTFTPKEKRTRLFWYRTETTSSAGSRYGCLVHTQVRLLCSHLPKKIAPRRKTNLNSF